VLEARMFGQSKLKIVRVIAGHVQLLFEIAAARIRVVRRGMPITAKQVTD
jgi:hypothetical protein